MKYLFIPAIMMVGLITLLVACYPHSHGDGSQGHSHASTEPVAEPISFTAWSKTAEFFVEFPPLVAGQESSFAAHITELANFKAVEAAEAMVCLFKNNKEVAVDTVSRPTSPGVFQLILTPPEAGAFDLSFVISTQNTRDTFNLGNIPVYPSEEAAIAAHPPQPEGEEIALLKEQAWKIDFAVQRVRRQSINEVIQTAGEIEAVKGEEKILSAKTSGIVFFKNKKLQEGLEVRAGEPLFSISSKGLVESNLEEQFNIAKARLQKTEADLERAEKLLAQQIIGRKEYERRKMDFSIASAEFQTLSGSFHQGGQALGAPMSGILKKVMVSDGQFVEEGSPLVEISSNRRLMVRADVSQQFLPKLSQIQSANFKTPYLETVQSIDDYNGKMLSYGKMIEEGSGFIPVWFELDNLGELIPGSFIELFLLTNKIENALVIPKTGLMEDYGSYYVYVQTGGESFEKRILKLGIDDGTNVQVLAGISEGERVVKTGAYQVKMASMSSAIPAHGHEH